MAAYFIRPVLSKTIGDIALAAVALSAGLHLGWIDRSKANFKAFSWMKTAAGIAGLVTATFMFGSLIMAGPGAVYHPYSDQLLKEAIAQKKPVIIDFSAVWCAPCRELEEITFRDPEVVKQSKKDFILVKVDLTRKGNPVYDRLLKQFDVRGVPTVVFIDPSGKERRDLRIVDFMPPGPFLVRMTQVVQPSDS
jgi:thiol:disulfide interchange protein DsbD